VVLVERGSHPRFALGESSTPLAALCLERLARRYGLEDLHALAAYGRWQQHLPHLRHGLKRGFTFFHHRPGEPFCNGPTNESRLLVAASPDATSADSHWLRADVDLHLVEAAEDAGVVVREQVTLESLECTEPWVEVAGQSPEGPFQLRADLLIDATGRGGFIAHHRPVPERPPTVQRDASLLFAHLKRVRPFTAVARGAGARLPPGPFPDDRAAVHHILDPGWMYVLPFDHGISSVGLVGAGDSGLRRLTATEAWYSILRRYPSLSQTFALGEPTRPFEWIPDIRHRLQRAAGRRWLALPHTYAFSDPLYSTGMGWSLSAVERIADLFAAAAPVVPAPSALARYGALLEVEADHLEDLIEGAYATLPNFPALVAQSLLYFAAASFQEVRHRLKDTGGWGWEGFLGSTDPVCREFVHQGRERLEDPTGVDVTAFTAWVRQAIAPRDIAGLADPDRNHLYPLDLDTLVQRATLLGMSPGQVEAALPRLRSA
jgi:tetracycline 7-halogenase / FADH2 O2-dependent halogenase